MTLSALTSSMKSIQKRCNQQTSANHIVHTFIFGSATVGSYQRCVKLMYMYKSKLKDIDITEEGMRALVSSNTGSLDTNRE